MKISFEKVEFCRPCYRGCCDDCRTWSLRSVASSFHQHGRVRREDVSICECPCNLLRQLEKMPIVNPSIHYYTKPEPSQSELNQQLIKQEREKRGRK